MIRRRGYVVVRRSCPVRSGPVRVLYPTGFTSFCVSCQLGNQVARELRGFQSRLLYTIGNLSHVNLCINLPVLSMLTMISELTVSYMIEIAD